MWVLGINAPPVGWHDTAVCLLLDGKLVAFGEEERFCRQKHGTNTSPVLAARYCLAVAGINFEDIDVVSFGWDLPRILHHYGRTWRGDDSVRELLNEWLEWKPSGKLPELCFVNHHLAHAACAFYSSPFNESTVIVVDGNGEEESISVFRASYKAGFATIRTWPRSHSLGYLYDATSRALGMSFLEAGKTMGLASYGAPSQLVPLKLLESSSDTLFEPPFVLPTSADYDEIIMAWQGAFARVGHRRVNTALSNLDKDPSAVLIAFSAQHAVEVTLAQVAAWARSETGLDELCLCGGVALNCSANGQIPDPIYVPPVPNDAGVALGAALYVCPPEFTGRPMSPYWGEDLDLSTLSGDRGAESEATVQAVVDRLLAGKIGGIASGRSEIGPRALCHRSIIALPGSLDLRDALNVRKHRELWRPLSPVSLASAYETFWPAKDFLQTYMLGASPVTERARLLLPGVVHVDGTARVQCLSEPQEPVFKYLSALEASGLPPVLINTSLNARGEPIASSAKDALDVANRNKLDFVVVNDVLFDMTAK